MLRYPYNALMMSAWQMEGHMTYKLFCSNNFQSSQTQGTLENMLEENLKVSSKYQL